MEPSALAKMPVVNRIDLSAYPDEPLNVLDIRENPSTCWWWERTRGENRARVKVISGPTIPVATHEMHKVVDLVKADMSGREADHVYFGPDYANFVAVTGNNPAAQTTESLWWLTDAGARFGVEDTKEAREALGLSLARAWPRGWRCGCCRRGPRCLEPMRWSNTTPYPWT
ncbi:hypothetical protein BZL30_5072 [Mycobacterium kansasii]|uniref:Uncharacterized protein n=1 Tax=Mycobacterium kansasii TaxID=1768 RepID=A0A1V3X2T4_MYCKA|nr:hypothetical protein BZL30_5072 [Mycobacterium kansasii]